MCERLKGAGSEVGIILVALCVAMYVLNGKAIFPEKSRYIFPAVSPSPRSIRRKRERGVKKKGGREKKERRSRRKGKCENVLIFIASFARAKHFAESDEADHITPGRDYQCNSV